MFTITGKAQIALDSAGRYRVGTSDGTSASGDITGTTDDDTTAVLNKSWSTQDIYMIKDNVVLTGKDSNVTITVSNGSQIWFTPGPNFTEDGKTHLNDAFAAGKLLLKGC